MQKAMKMRPKTVDMSVHVESNLKMVVFWRHPGGAREAPGALRSVGWGRAVGLDGRDVLQGSGFGAVRHWALAVGRSYSRMQIHKRLLFETNLEQQRLLQH